MSKVIFIILTLYVKEGAMRAVIRRRYGGPEVLEVGDVPTPDLTGDDRVLIRVIASSLNAGDWYAMSGRPWVARPTMGFRKPKSVLIGGDFSGVVEAVGPAVTDFKPGDEVFGMRSGSLAQYVVKAKGSLVLKPGNSTFEDAATVPIAAITALQALRDKGGLQEGQRVLINGAAGGVGTFAVQLAKVLGAEVTAVCSARNVEMVKSLGADRVVDYTSEDFTRIGQLHDLMIDIAGSRKLRDYRQVLEPDAPIVIVGGPKGGRLLGPIAHVVRTRLAAIRSQHKVLFFVARDAKEDLLYLKGLIEDNLITPVIDRTYGIDQIREAMEYLATGHARAKIAVTIGDGTRSQEAPEV